MTYLVPGKPLNLEGVVVSPSFQWLYGAFTLFTIPVIVSAGVGVLYVMETHIDTYAYTLLVSLALDVIYFMVFLIYGRGCTTKTVGIERNHFIATLSCGVHDGFTLLCLTLLILFKAIGLYLTNKTKAYIRSVYYHNFIPYMQKHLATLDYPKPEENEVTDLLPKMSSDLRTQPPKTGRWGSQFLNSMPVNGLLKNMPANFPTVLPSMMSQATAFPPRAYPSAGTLQPSMGPMMATGRRLPPTLPTSIQSAAVPATRVAVPSTLSPPSASSLSPRSSATLSPRMATSTIL